MPVVVTIDVEFGDHPSTDPHGTLSRICDALDEYHAPATLFVQGRWARAFPDLVAEFASRDVTIGLHGYSHVDYRRLSIDGIRAELADGLAALSDAAPGLEVRYTRLPYGYGSDDPTICDVLSEAGLTPVGWDFSTFDWDETLPFEKSLGRALGSVSNGGVVMFHSWPDRTPELLRQLLAAAGAAVVELDAVELIGRQRNGRTIHVERTDPSR